MKLFNKSGLMGGEIMAKVLIILAVLLIMSIIIWQSKGVMMALIDKFR
jgi:hypothetical protein